MLAGKENRLSPDLFPKLSFMQGMVKCTLELEEDSQEHGGTTCSASVQAGEPRKCRLIAREIRNNRSDGAHQLQGWDRRQKSKNSKHRAGI